MKSLLAFLLGSLAHASASTMLYTLKNSDVSSDSMMSCGMELYRNPETGIMQATGGAEHEQVLRDMGFEVLAVEHGKPFSAFNYTDYHNPEALLQSFQNLATKYPKTAKVIDVTAEVNGEATYGGRHIHAIKISDNVDVDEDEPNYLVISNHHCRELVTPEIALDLATTLITNPDMEDIVNNNQVYIMWTLNPDGLDFVWNNDNMWRKNRRDNGDGTHGVDLNRNYPVGWGYTCGGDDVTDSETYRGPSALSEPETRTMAAFQAERRFAKVMDFHSYAREVRINYGDCAHLPDEVDTMFKDVAQNLAELAGYEQARSCCMGGNIHMAYNQYGSLSFLVETATAFQPKPEAMLEELERIRPAALFFLEIPIPVYGHIIDGETGLGVEASIEIPDLDFSENEMNLSRPGTGRFHMWVPAGSYSLVVRRMDNKATKVVSVTAMEKGNYVKIIV